MVKFVLQKPITDIKRKIIPNSFSQLGIYIFILAFSFILAYVLYYILHRQAKIKTNNNKIIFDLLSEIVFYAVILFGVLTVIVNMGFNLNTLAVIIGSVGIALALALQNSMRNISSGLMILFLEYYDIGDLIQIDDRIGYVENFNLFVTTIKDLNDVLIKIPNNTITEGVLTNYYKNEEIDFTFDVSISNSDKTVNIEDICVKIKERIIAECEYVSNPEKVLVIVNDMSSQGTKLQIFIPVKSENYVATKWSSQLIVRKVITENNLNLLDYYYRDGTNSINNKI